jgi:glycerol-3-phosphate dehydrogenase (NAD(P)+)
MQLDRGPSQVVLWARDPDKIADIRQTRINERYLPEHRLPESIELTSDLQAAVSASDHLLLVVPSHAFGDTLNALSPFLKEGQGVAWGCKGFEPGSGRFLHEVARQSLDTERLLAVVTGPSFAAEVASDLPTAVTVAGENESFTSLIAQALHGSSFRAYNSDDVVGAELGGAVKNVLAVATGICDGMELGDNARAALITRGLAEMMRLGQALGARPETLMGLAGAGDLVLTCTGDLSRNRRFGLAVGQGQSVADAQAAISQVIEGVKTSLEVHRLATQHQVSMPISKQVYGIIHQGWDPREGVKRLLSREQKSEIA